MELDDAERILKADAVGARSGAFVGDFDSKKMCGQALFPCPVGHEVGDELALSDVQAWLGLARPDEGLRKSKPGPQAFKSLSRPKPWA